MWQALHGKHGPAQKPDHRSQQPDECRALLQYHLNAGGGNTQCHSDRQRRGQYNQTRKRIGMDGSPEQRNADDKIDSKIRKFPRKGRDRTEDHQFRGSGRGRHQHFDRPRRLCLLHGTDKGLRAENEKRVEAGANQEKGKVFHAPRTESRPDRLRKKEERRHLCKQADDRGHKTCPVADCNQQVPAEYSEQLVDSRVHGTIPARCSNSECASPSPVTRKKNDRICSTLLPSAATERSASNSPRWSNSNRSPTAAASAKLCVASRIVVSCSAKFRSIAQKWAVLPASRLRVGSSKSRTAGPLTS